MSAGSLVLQHKHGLSGCIYTLRLGGRRGVAGLLAFEISPLCLHTPTSLKSASQRDLGSGTASTGFFGARGKPPKQPGWAGLVTQISCSDFCCFYSIPAVRGAGEMQVRKANALCLLLHVA